MLPLLALILIVPFFSSPALAQAPPSVLIKTEHYIDALLQLENRITNNESLQISDDCTKVKLSETIAAIAGVPLWIVTPPTEQVEFRWVHGIDRCGCVDGDDYANGYNDFDYAWKLRVPASRLISLEYAQACLGGSDSIDVFVSALLEGPWVKIFAIKVPAYCRYSWNPAEPYYINLPISLVPNTDYWLRLVSRYYSIDIFKLNVIAQEPIGTETSSWGAIKQIYR